MKKISILISFLLMFVLTQAQIRINDFETNNSSEKEKVMVVSAGIGYPNLFNLVKQTDLKQHFDRNRNHLYNYSGVPSYSTNLRAAFLLKGEYRHNQKNSFGINLGYCNIEWNAKSVYTLQSNYYWPDTTEYLCTEKIRYSSFSIGARYNTYWIDEGNFQFYSGFGTGLTFNKVSDELMDNGVLRKSYFSIDQIFDPVTYYFTLTAGARYFLFENAGIYCEVGYEKWSVIQAGITFKL